MTDSSRLKTLLDRGDFVVTAEITPRLTTDAADFLEQAAPLKGRADAVNVTDGAGAYLLSDLSSGVTGVNHHVDCGYHAVGMLAVDAVPDIREMLENFTPQE